MEKNWRGLGLVDPRALVEARRQAHRAVQWVTRLARGNLPAMPDDSQSNLGWDAPRLALLSHDLVAADGTRCRAGLHLPEMALFLARGAAEIGALPLDGTEDRAAGAWLDALAMGVGLRPAGSVVLPYAIAPDPVAAGAAYAAAAQRDTLAELARWYEAADEVLQETRAALVAAGREPSAVRCWPHHFDIATLLTLSAGDHESATSTGIGMSPGDDDYAQPYFYVSPWPAPPADQALPDAPSPGHWHRDGFTAAVATAEELLALSDRHNGTRRFIAAAIRRLVPATDALRSFGEGA